jgi:putative transposase
MAMHDGEKRKRRAPQQLVLAMPTRGGVRKGAGRKRQSPRPRVAHVARDAFRPEHPLHVTLRVRAGVPCLRSRVAWASIVRAFRAARDRPSLRIVHYAVMSNHLHLLIEADGGEALSIGMRSLMTRLATRLNRTLARSGPIFADRFHARPIATPRAARHALQYVLLNARKHAAELGRTLPAAWIDPRSSAARFDGWLRPPCCEKVDADFGTSPACTWLLRSGWRRHGLLATDEVPGCRGHSGSHALRRLPHDEHRRPRPARMTAPAIVAPRAPRAQ